MKKSSTLKSVSKLVMGGFLMAATPLYVFAANNAGLSDMLGNGGDILKAVLLLVVGAAGLYGFIVAFMGVAGLMSKNPNESKVSAGYQVILGAALFSLMAVIVALNTEFIGDSSEVDTTINLIRD
ncbi:hypothetical protein P4S73_02600 [Paraglaciecola sp. Hal342]|jgi:hypothetical protein|tara:strand:+ start:1270 stop:1644 length:375 start_codon:yes stop_codon:yes gene_type:complete